MKRRFSAKIVFFVFSLCACAVADEIADYIKPLFKTYQIMQDAYFMETEKVGSFEQIGFSPAQIPYGVSLENVGGPASHKYILASVVTVRNCPSGTKWEMHSVVSEGELCYEVFVSEEQRCGDVEAFCNLATSGKCGNDCSEKDVVCSRGTEYNEIFKLCSAVCPKGMYRPWWDPDGGSAYEPQECVAVPGNAHKVKKNGTFYKGGSYNQEYSPNEWAWECNSGFSRHSGNKCQNWPKGVILSDRCWISSINRSALKKIMPNAEHVYIPDGIFDPGIDLKDTLDVVDFFRGPLNGTSEFVANGKKISCRRTRVLVDANTETTSLGPYSGCWECPSGTFYDENKNECVVGEDPFGKKPLCRIIGKWTEE